MSVQSADAFIIDQIRCPECPATCLQKNIYRHMVGSHNWTRDDCKVLVNAIRTEKRGRETKTSFICNFCSIMFRSIRHLVQHKRVCDQPQISEELVEEYLDQVIVEEPEYIIDDKPSTSANFEQVIPPHRQSARPIQPHHLPPQKLLIQPSPDDKLKFPSMGRHRGTQTKCPECPTTVDSIEDLLSHCREKHELEDRKFLTERRLFETKDEFKKWFDQRQEDTCTSLTKRTGHGGETFYRCHRVGKYQSVAKARKSNPRKIDQTCTAYLKVFTQEDGSTWANGCFTHIGHELDHKLLWLTETQENYVRELIDLRWNSDQIFFYIRDEYNNYECKLKYISKNDIRNITVRYNREKAKKTGFVVTEKRAPIPIREEKKPGGDKITDKADNDVLEPAEDLGPEPPEPPSKVPRASSEDILEPAEPLEPVESPLPPSESPEASESQKVPAAEEENEYINVVDDEPPVEKTDN